MAVSASAPGRRVEPATVLWAAVFAYFWLYVFCIALESVFHFTGSGIDGPFQLYNALRRMAVGQRPGVDFQFFHGIGIPYLHYPLFRLLGTTFFASELTRQIVSVTLYPLVVLAVLRTFTKNWTRTFALAAAVMALSLALRITSVLAAVNSILGVRASLPTLLPVMLFLPRRSRARALAAGVGLGLAFLLGTEQGLAAWAAILIATAVWAGRADAPRRRALAMEAAGITAAAIATVGLLLLAVGGVAGMRGALHYNLRLVSMDQYWYFGAPPNPFISSWSALLPMLAGTPRILITVVLTLAAAMLAVRRLWRAPVGTDDGHRAFALAVLTLYGLVSLVSLLGLYVPVYTQPCLRVLLLVGALELDRVLTTRKVGLPGLVPAHGYPLVVAGAIVVLLLAAPRIALSSPATIARAFGDHFIGGDAPVYSAFWPQTIVTGQRVMDAHRGNDGKPPALWSTYAGLIEARNGLFHPVSDYIIHVLGPEQRQRYLSEFRRTRPTLVQTVSPGYSPYEVWIEQTSWDLYAELLRHYRVAQPTPWSLFWERLPAARPEPMALGTMPLAPGARGVALPVVARTVADSGLALLEIELTYRAVNRLSWLPVIGSLPRYLVFTNGAINREPITLDPYTMTARFPLVVRAGDGPALAFRTFSLLPGAGLEVSAVRVSRWSIDAANRDWFDALVMQQSQHDATMVRPGP
jgi:hypothetical protein